MPKYCFLLACCCCLLLAAKVTAQTPGHDSNTCRYLKSIHIEGAGKTRHAVILRELNIREGDCIPADSMEAVAQLSRLRLMNIQLFNEVQINWQPLAADSLNMQIRVYERFPVTPDPVVEFADRNFNVWWSEQQHDLRRINLGLALVHRNFRGNREQVSILGQIGYTQKVGIAYERPFIDRQQKHGAGISFYGMQNREIAYRTDSNKLSFYRSPTHAMLRQTELSAWYTYRPQYASIHKLSLSYQHYWISNTIANMNPEYLGGGKKEEDILTLNYLYKYNGVDNWEYPLTGMRIIGSLQQQFTLKNKYNQSKIYLQADRYWHAGKKWYMSLVFRGKLSFPQTQPYIFQKNMGYDYDYVRGYEYYVIDGSSFALLRATLKRELLNVKIHLPIRYFQVIPLRIYPKIYADAGRVYNANPYNDYLYNKMLYSAGVGLDVVTFYDIKVRIEYTFNALGENGLYLHKSGE